MTDRRLIRWLLLLTLTMCAFIGAFIACRFWSRQSLYASCMSQTNQSETCLRMIE